MLEIIGAGFPRTGTASMKAALERLGFGPTYHMYEVLTHPDHINRWLPVASGIGGDWDRVFRGYVSTQDWPASHFWLELAEAYPKAKVILTVRDPHAWYRSMRMLMSVSARMLDEAAREATRPSAAAILELMSPLLTRIGQVHFGNDWKFGNDLPDKDLALEAFQQHTATVQQSLSPERLLIFDVRQGWEPLCSFLGVPVPAGEQFPHLNDTDWMKQSLKQVQVEGEILTPFK